MWQRLSLQHWHWEILQHIVTFTACNYRDSSKTIVGANWGATVRNLPRSWICTSPQSNYSRKKKHNANNWLCLHLCVCLFGCWCTCVCIYFYVCACMCMYVYMCVCVCAYACVYMCVPACLHMCMYMNVFVNNWEYPTDYIQQLSYDTLKNCFQHNNFFYHKKESGVKMGKQNYVGSSVILELWHRMIKSW